MRVTLVPEGRGNWAPMVLEYDGRQLLPLEVRVGWIMVFAGMRWRVRSVTA